MPGGGLRHIKNSSQIDRDDFVPFFGSDIEKVMADADAGIVDQNVHAAHQADSLGKGGLHLL